MNKPLEERNATMTGVCSSNDWMASFLFKGSAILTQPVIEAKARVKARIIYLVPKVSIYTHYAAY